MAYEPNYAQGVTDERRRVLREIESCLEDWNYEAAAASGADCSLAQHVRAVLVNLGAFVIGGLDSGTPDETAVEEWVRRVDPTG